MDTMPTQITHVLLARLGARPVHLTLTVLHASPWQLPTTMDLVPAPPELTSQFLLTESDIAPHVQLTVWPALIQTPALPARLLMSLLLIKNASALLETLLTVLVRTVFPAPLDAKAALPAQLARVASVLSYFRVADVKLHAAMDSLLLDLSVKDAPQVV